MKKSTVSIIAVGLIVAFVGIGLVYWQDSMKTASDPTDKYVSPDKYDSQVTIGKVTEKTFHIDPMTGETGSIAMPLSRSAIFYLYDSTGSCYKNVDWLNLQTELFPIDKQSNDRIMHLDGF